MSEDTVRANRAVWESASRKHVREYETLLAEARTGLALTAAEREMLGPILQRRPTVVHLQSGHGLDDVALVKFGAARVIGVDYSTVAVSAAARRADELGMPCAYVAAQLPPAPLRDSCADLVYTGKGALIWMPDLVAWARDVVRLVTRGGHLFVHEAHPMVPLYSWDTDRTSIRPDRRYFDHAHVNDSFPAHGAVEWQWTLGEVITVVVQAGLRVLELREHPEPFWRAGGIDAAAWNGHLPNTFSLLAQRP
ncbi:MAG: SAM-dependent methyltransferase [Pseudonocardiales bacterium]|nr:MAG: SAM-dependent methyltransferase [Pseudonocardiales bacterium]